MSLTVFSRTRSGAATPNGGGTGTRASDASVNKTVLLRRLASWAAGLAATAFLALTLAVPVLATFHQSIEFKPSWGAYTHHLTNGSDLRLLWRTLALAASATALTLLMGYPVAYAMTLVGSRLRKVIIGLLVLPYLTSFLVRTYAWIGVLGFSGPVVWLAHLLGFNTTSFNFTATGVLIVLVHIFLPLVIFACYVSMARIDPSHIRAAKTLGARHLEAFWRVYAPQTKSGIVSASVLVFISAAGIYATPALIGGPREATVVSRVVTDAQSGVFLGVPQAYPAAFAVILALVVVIVLGLAARYVAIGELLGLSSKEGTRHAGRRSTSQLAMPKRRPVSAALRHLPGGGGRQRHVFVGLATVLAVVIIDGPLIYLVGMSFQPLSLLAFPTHGWSTRWYTAVFNDPTWGDAAWESAKIATLATVVALVLGSYLAMRTVKLRPSGAKVVAVTAILPLLIPGVMYALGIYVVFVRLNLIGNWVAISFVHSVLALPFVYINVLNALHAYDPVWDRAAYSLGSSSWRRLRKITLPILRPALITGAFLAALASLDEFTVTLFMGGSFYENLPLKFWTGAKQELSPELAVVGVMLVGFIVAMAAVVALGSRLSHGTTTPTRSDA